MQDWAPCERYAIINVFHAMQLHRELSTWALDRSILSPSLEIAHTEHGLGLRTRVPVAHGEVLVNASSLALTAARALALRPDIADLLEPHDVEPHVEESPRLPQRLQNLALINRTCAPQLIAQYASKEPSGRSQRRSPACSWPEPEVD